jgi:hypothetical protein
MRSPYLTPSDRMRFWGYVKKTETCWEWTGFLRGRKPGQYGGFQLGRKCYLAHRISWIICHGKDLSADACVCHHCDNTTCVRPDHLFVGTQRDNTHDMIAKGRAKNVIADRLRARSSCIKGHPWSEANTHWVRQRKGDLRRVCRTCGRDYWRRKAEK